MITRISVEQAFAETMAMAASAVEQFRAMAGEWPDLRLLPHLDAVGSILDLPRWERRNPEIAGYDLAYALLRHLIEQAPYSPMNSLTGDRVTLFADAILGRVYYNPPAREFLLRLESLDSPQSEDELANTHEHIRRLAHFIGQINETVSSGIAASEAMRARIMDRFSNPYLWIESRLRKYCLTDDHQGFGDLRDYYERCVAACMANTGSKYS